MSLRARSPEDITTIAFARSRLVLVNEAHSGLRRSIRCRQTGLRIVRAAHDAGVRHLAMEALWSPELAARANASRRPPAGSGYLAQPEMTALIAGALDLGWTLHAYEADMDSRPAAFAPRSIAETNWREGRQAANLAAVTAELPPGAGLLVWCGNHHLARRPVEDWQPMGSLLPELTGIEPFAVDQTAATWFDEGQPPPGARWVEDLGEHLAAHGGVAGFLAEEAPPGWPVDVADAYLLARDDVLR